jgi:Uma2 family endonuclease
MKLRENVPQHELGYYLVFVETNRPLRFEYAGGHIYPIEAATPTHAAIEANIAAAILPQLKGTNCRGYGSSLVVIAGEDYANMPEFTVVCGEAILRQGKRGTGVANPVLIVEILSPSNKPYDRHGKF